MTMTAQDFVDALKIVVREPSIFQTIEHIRNPPGLKVRADIRTMSTWIKSLSKEDLEALQMVIKEAVDSSIFGLLSVLDGCATIENGPYKGRIFLLYEGKKGGMVNISKGVNLHELY